MTTKAPSISPFPPPTKPPPHPILIIGAGPVGLLTALHLGIASIPTIVLESHITLLPTTRAMVYMPLITPVLRSVNLLSTISKIAYLNHDGVVWRDPSGKILARLRLESEDGSSAGGDEEFGGTYQLGQAKMNAIILEEIKRYSCVEVRFGHRLIGIRDDSEEISVTAIVHQTDTSTEIEISGSYILGTDGINSTVRKTMDIPFEGFSFQDFKMLGTDVLFDFGGEMGWGPLNFFVDPGGDWGVVAFTGEYEYPADESPEVEKITKWRVAFGEPVGLSDKKEDILDRANERIGTFLRERGWEGNGGFEVVRAESFWLHQRCAGEARKGRVLLAGDALHSNNPIGGLGLTSGILDAHVYANALIGALSPHSTAAEADILLTKAANSRRGAWLNHTSPLSMGNLRRLQSTDTKDVETREEFFGKLNADEGFWRVVRKGLDGIWGDDR